MTILKNLNPKQQEAVTATEGPVLIIAGPGSGKTKVLTHRVAYLIREKQIGARNILAVTFTNKAAQEMKNRIKDLLAETENSNLSSKIPPAPFDKGGISQFPIPNSQLPIIGTFHSVCVRILRREIEKIDFKKNFVIYDDTDQLRMIKKIMAELNINTEQFNPRAVLSQISKAKNELLNPERYAEQAGGYFEEIVIKIYQSYSRQLKKAGALDFDDLIMKTIQVFQEHPAALEKYQRWFQYVLVDEYQDTNHAQYTLVNLISRARNNLCVVGDDWQSIYRWRGADIRNILEFEKDYPDAKVILLEQNYRSTQKILNAAAGVIDKNINRKDKKLWTEKSAGHSVIAYEAQNESGEANFVLTEIAKLQQRLNLKLNDFAVLYRTNAQSRALEEECLKLEAPYRIVGGIKFYARAEIKDILAYLRVIQNPNDLIGLERIINIPPRGIGEVTFGKVSKLAEKSGKDFIEIIGWLNMEEDKTSPNPLLRKEGSESNPPLTKERSEKNPPLTKGGLEGVLIDKNKLAKLKNFAAIIKKCREASRQKTVSDLLKFILKETDHQKYLQDGTEEGERRWENVKELFSVTEKYDSLPPQEGLEKFLEEVALITDLDQVDEKKDAITLMTLHSAKGLEFHTVFIIGLEEGLLPHSRSNSDKAEMEEERRLCYVGITRAKERVYLVFARARKLYGSVQANTPSRFLNDIPEELIEFQKQEFEEEIIEY